MLTLSELSFDQVGSSPIMVVKLCGWGAE